MRRILAVIIFKPDGLRFWLTFWAQRLVMLPLVWLVFRVFNHVKVEGLENLDEVDGESLIIAPNHTTAWDGWIGTVYALSARHRYVDRKNYTAVLAAPENIPRVLRWLVAILGAIPVDRESGIDQFAMNDTVRVFDEGRCRFVLTVYPEGTRSKNGRLRRRGRPGIGWLQHQSKATVVPVYHCGGTRMPGLGLRMTLRIGKPLRMERWRDAPNELPTWRGITGEIMDSLRDMEREALDQDPDGQPPRHRRIPRWRERRSPKGKGSSKKPRRLIGAG